MPEMNLIEAIRQALDEEMARDEAVFLAGNDIGDLGGLFRTTRGLQAKYSRGRVIDAPLSTSALVGLCIGAALRGKRPVCEIQLADQLPLAFNQIVNEAARIHYRTNGDWNVPLVVRAPYGGGTGGGLYESQSPEAYFTQVPGLKVVIPSNPYEAKGLLKAAVRDPNPVLFLEPKYGYRNMRGEVPDTDYTVPIGPAVVSRPGRDLTAIAYGAMHALALQAADKLAEEAEIDVEVIDLRTLYPLDKDTLLTSVHNTSKAIIIHEAPLTGGFGAEIAAILAAEAFASLDAPVRRLTTPDLPAIPFSPTLYAAHMLTMEKITAAMQELANY
ncbi:MAG: alpha-ketoacid dehydrogenase subunit beta [Anaerolineaceae bacterium]|nr:alpha-ketoacid dehydrogenase subunit beta [Anaerolineaceae bacterium]